MIDFKELLKAGVHFGHKTSFGNPKMRPYIWGAKNRIHLIDVAKTAALLEHAGQRLKRLVSNGKSILWVGTKKPAKSIIEEVSKNLGMSFVVNRWIGGTLSNYGQVKKAITRLLHLRDILKKPTSFYTKKELVMLQKQLARLERNVGGIIDLEFPPAAIVVIDAKKEHSAVKEAHGMKIPVIALVDTNTDPSFVSNVIPTNDDSPRAIKLIIEYLAKFVEEGKKIAAENKKAKLTEKKASSSTEEKKSAKKAAATPSEKAPVEAKKKEATAEKKTKAPAAKKTVKKAAAPKKEATEKKETAPKAKTAKKAVKKTADKK